MPWVAGRQKCKVKEASWSRWKKLGGERGVALQPTRKLQARIVVGYSTRSISNVKTLKREKVAGVQVVTSYGCKCRLIQRL